MNDQDLQSAIHDLDVTVRVGKGGIGSVIDEVDEQLRHHDLVKIKLLRSARGSNEPDDVFGELADAVDAEVVDVRGFTGVIGR